MKSYKKLYEELKSQKDIQCKSTDLQVSTKTLIDSKIENHKQSYIHIPFSWKRIGLFFCFLGSLGLSIGNFFLLISIGNAFRVWELLGQTNEQSKLNPIANFNQLIIYYPLIGEYILIGITVICLAAMIKGGFNNLKSYKENGLIAGLIYSLIAVLIASLILGLIVGLIASLILGLIVGLIFGLIYGYPEEFN